MRHRTIRPAQTATRLVALLAALVLLAATMFAGWHDRVAAAGTGHALTVSAGASTGDDTPLHATDCAFHCEQHARGLSALAAGSFEAPALPPSLLDRRDSHVDFACADDLFDPPRA